MMGLKGKLGTALLSASMLGMLINWNTCTGSK